MYFGEIFVRFRSLVPKMAVVVDQATQFINPYRLPLRPLMRVFRLPIRRTNSDGQAYDTEVAIPSPVFLGRLAAQKADVFIVIEFTLPALMATLIATLFRKQKVVLLIESDPAGRGASAHPIVLMIKRWAARRASVVQTNNWKGRRYIVEELLVDPAKVRIAPYLTSRPPGPEIQVVARTGPVELLFVNNITPRKGLRQFAEAIALLDPGTRRQIALTIVGDGPDRNEVQQRLGALDLGRVTFVGSRPYRELGSFYAKAEVLVITSLADYRSLAGFEGLGYGLVLLASCLDGATEETVRDGVNGFVINPLDPAGVADRIATLVKDRHAIVGMRLASLALYRDRFSMEAIAANIANSVVAAAGG